jgi:5-deoxy-D-glucuronate isomerase
MERTMRKYAVRIEKNEINPHVRYDGQTSGLILDPLLEEVPLEILGFGIYRLGSKPITRETKEKEVILVPQEGEFEAEVNGKKFHGGRIGGLFSMGPGKSNASALYIPCNSKLSICGKGEVAFFEAPALKEKKPAFVSSEEVKVLSRGDWIWRRDVIPLVSPKDASSNLVVGETYSPPGFWSGTPLHQHDSSQPSTAESDHEEVYYHRFNWVKKPGDQYGPYGVQLLMGGKSLMKAFLIGDKSVIAIPGGCHPVVASPVSELCYLWGLAGGGNELVARDIAEFLHLKSFEEIFRELEGGRVNRTLSRKKFRNLCATHRLTGEQAELLSAMLREKGYEIESL